MVRTAAPIALAGLGGPVRRAQRHGEHRPRGHDDHGHDLRRLVGLARGPVDGDPRRRHRRHPRRPAARPGDGDVRRQPHRVRLRDQHHRPRRRPVHGRPAVRRRQPAPASTAGRSATRPASARPSAASRCRSCRAATCSAGRRPTRSGGWRTRGGSSSPTSPGCCGGLTTGADARHHPHRRRSSSSPGTCCGGRAFGLRLRSAGERPTAADSLGVPVIRYRYYGMIISGGLAGLGGAVLVLFANRYQEGQTGGRGFLGLATLVVGNWRPAGVAFGAALFGYFQGITLRTEPRAARAGAAARRLDRAVRRRHAGRSSAASGSRCSAS